MNKKKLLILIGIIIILDQTIKILLIDKNITIIQGLLNFNYTENTGTAFGICSNNIVTIIIVNIIVLGFIIKFLKKKIEQVDFYVVIALVLTLAGGISNLIDRIVRGYVIDFIDVNLFNFPCFNIADISITIGIVLLIICIIKSQFMKEESKKNILLKILLI